MFHCFMSYPILFCVLLNGTIGLLDNTITVPLKDITVASRIGDIIKITWRLKYCTFLPTVSVFYSIVR